MTTATGGPSDAGSRIRPAVLQHAADLFAEKGPAATSLRDIADRSGVNAGLIHRHVGNKDAIVAAVLEYLAEDLSALRREGAAADVVEARAERNWKVIARALLDGFDIGRLQQRFPNVESVLARAREVHDDDLSARLATADALALQLGWRLFGPFLRVATGLVDDMPVDRPSDGSGAALLDDPRGLDRQPDVRYRTSRKRSGDSVGT